MLGKTVTRSLTLHTSLCAATAVLRRPNMIPGFGNDASAAWLQRTIACIERPSKTSLSALP